MIERAGIKLVDVTGIEPVTPCLQSRGKHQRLCLVSCTKMQQSTQGLRPTANTFVLHPKEVRNKVNSLIWQSYSKPVASASNGCGGRNMRQSRLIGISSVFLAAALSVPAWGADPAQPENAKANPARTGS